MPGAAALSVRHGDRRRRAGRGRTSKLAFVGQHLAARGLVFIEGHIASGAVVLFGGTARTADELRHGDGCTVEGNVFLGENKPHTGGVRAIGRRHVVRGNHFRGLTGLPTAGAIIAIYAGIPNSVPTGYVEAESAVISENVLVDNAGNGINLGAGHLSRGRTILPRNVTISNNWIDQHPQFDATVLTGTPAEGLKCPGSVYRPHSEIGFAPPGGFKGLWFTGDPDLAFPLHPELAPPETTEHDGWKATMAALEPLQPKDVGPAWWER